MEVQIRTRAIILGIKASIRTDEKGNLSIKLDKHPKKYKEEKAKAVKKVKVAKGVASKKGTKHA